MKRLLFNVLVASAIIWLRLVRSDAQSNLQTVSSGMALGTWQTLATTNMAAVIGGTNGTDNVIFTYSDGMVWDTTNKKLWYIGSDHGGTIPCPQAGGYYGYRVVHYLESTNAWTLDFTPTTANCADPSIGDGPPYYPGYKANSTVGPPILVNGGDAHGYNSTAIDVGRRRLYRYPYCSRKVFYTNLDTGGALGTMVALPDPPSNNACGGEVLEFFPDIDALILLYADGSMYLYHATGNNWTTVVTAPSFGADFSWTFARYNPVKHIVMYGYSGGFVDHFFKLATSLVVTTIASAPTGEIYDGTGYNGLVACDTNSGFYYILGDASSGRHFWKYDVDANSYTALPTPPTPLSTSIGFAQAFISSYGVLAVAFGHSTTFGVYLYKSSNGQCTGPFTISNQEPVGCVPYPGGLITTPLPNAGLGGPVNHLLGNTGSSAASDAMVALIAGEVGQSGMFKISIGTSTTNVASMNNTRMNAFTTDEPMYYGNASDPLWTFDCTNVSANCGTGMTTGFQAHIPNGAHFSDIRGNGNGDSNMTVFDQTTNKYIDLVANDDMGAFHYGNRYFEVSNCCTKNMAFLAGVVVDRGVLPDYGAPSGHNSLHIKPPAHVIRYAELINGSINHAILFVSRCQKDNVSPLYVFPATSGGVLGCSMATGSPSSTNRPLMGQLFFLDYTPAQIAAMSIENYKKVILTAGATYGFYFSDTSDTAAADLEFHEGDEAYAVAGINPSPFFAFAAANSIPCNPGGSNVDAPTNTCDIRPMVGLPSDWASHIHVADPCVPLGMAGQAGGCVSAPGPFTYYVNKAGSDSNSCTTAQSTTPTNAKLTINQGILCMVAGDGDTLIIGNGTYVESIINSIPTGTSGHTTIVQAANPNLAIIKPSGNVDYGIEFAANSTNITINGLDVDMSNATSGLQEGIDCSPASTCSNISIQNGTVTGAKGSGIKGRFSSSLILNETVSSNGANSTTNGIDVSGSTNIIDTNRVSSQTGGFCIQVYYGPSAISNNTVRNNSMTGCGSGGILTGDADNGLIYNNIIYASTGSGIFTIGGAATNTKIYSNTIYNNSSRCILNGDAVNGVPTGSIIQNNICYLNTVGAIVDNGTGSTISNNLTTGNPLFLNAGAGDFHLLTGSPAIGSGINLSAIFTTDFSGTTRTIPWSMGAFNAVASTAIQTVKLTSVVGGSNLPFSIGVAFKKGDIPSGIFATTDQVNTQVIVKRLWNDGSVKHAVISGRMAAMTANVAVNLNITSTSTAPTGTNLTAADIQAANPTASVTVGSVCTVNLSSLLATPFRTWISGPQMVEAHYRTACGSDPTLVVWFYVRLWAGGAMWVREFVENGYLDIVPVDKTYVPTLSVNGSTVYTFPTKNITGAVQTATETHDSNGSILYHETITAPAHGFLINQMFYVSGVGGMVELNNRHIPAIAVTANTLQTPDHIIYGVGITAISRTSNVVTVTAIGTYTIGQVVTIDNVVNTSFNGDFTLTGGGNGTFTYSQIAANASSSGGTATIHTPYGTYTSGGTVAFSHSIRNRYMAEGWIGTDPQITPQHDTIYLTSTKLVPYYWKRNPSNDILNGTGVTWPYQAIQVYTPMAGANYSPNMGQTGYQNQIGLIPLWDALYVTSNADPRAYRATIATAKALSSYPIIWTSSTTKLPATPTEFPGWSVFGPTGEGGTDQGTGGLSWDVAHHPSGGYLAYIITGDYYYLDTLANQTALTYLIDSSAHGTGLNRITGGQTRGVAWTERTQGQYAAIAPTGDPVAADYRALLNNNAAFWGTWILNPNINPLGYLYSYELSGAQLGIGVASMFEQAFWTQSAGFVSDLDPFPDMTTWNRLRDYMYKSAVGILGPSGSSNFCFTEAGGFPIKVSAVSNNDPTTWYTDYGTVYTQSVPLMSPGAPPNTACGNTLLGLSGSDPSQANGGFWGNMIPAIAYAVDHGAPGALAAWNRLTGATNWDSGVGSVGASGFDDVPQWGIIPYTTVVNPPPFGFVVSSIGQGGLIGTGALLNVGGLK